MIDMKLTPQQAPADMLLGMPQDEPNEAPLYPEGLCIKLDNDALRKLGIGAGNLPAVGARMRLAALVQVVEVCNEPKQIDSELCVELQITHMEIGPENVPNEQQAAHARIAGMFGNGNG